MFRWLGFLAPGLPQLLRGKVPEGAGACFLWISLLALASVRFDRLSATFAGGLDDWLASIKGEDTPEPFADEETLEGLRELGYIQ